MIKSACIILIGIFLSNLAFSEGGNVYLKHYNHSCKDADNYNFWIKEEKSGIMIFANSKGLLSYDGVQWHLIKTEHPPLSIEVDKRTDKIYAGFRNDFGYFLRNEKGNLEYTSLSKKFKLNEIGEIVRIFITDTYIFYCNSHHVYQIDANAEVLLRKIEANYSGYAIYKNQFLANISGKGLHQLSSGNLIPIKSGKLFATDELLFGIKIEEDKILLGTSADDLFYYNGNEVTKFNTEAENYIHQHLLSDAVAINEKELIIGTLAGGCLILNKTTGKINNFVTIRTGLPDNEIIALGRDKNGGVWISHNYGFSRIDQFLPFKEYTYYDGLEGNLTSVLSYKNQLYISTSDGVFNFKKTERKETVYRSPNQQKNNHPSKKELPNIFENIFPLKRIKRNEKAVDHYPVHSKFQPSANRKKFSDLDEFNYQKVEGIDTKCKALIPFSEGILAATVQGLFEIKGNKAKAIVKETYINCIIPTQKPNCFLLGTKNGIYYAQFYNNQWKTSQILKDHFNAYSLTLSKQNVLWVGSNGKLIAVKLNSSYEILEKKIYYLDQFYNENVLTRNIQGCTNFFTSSQVYYYDSNKDTILKDLRWSHSNGNFTFSANQVKLTWYHTDSTWTGLDATNENKKLALSYLSFFNHPKDIYMDEENNVWIIDETNRLFKFESQKMIDLKNFQVHLQSVRTENGMVLPLKDIHLDYKSNSLRFSMAAPFYFDEKSVQFQYHLEGMTTGWSSWTRDHKIEFTYLPSGEYKLHIRAKNGLGQVSEVQKVEFKILPPYWKTSWFFVAEILFFMSLVIISTVLNQNNESSFFTKVMTFLTLIILMEFLVYQIESIFPAGNADNPIIRLGFNVILAMMISPFEKILEFIISKKNRRIAKIRLMWRKTSGLLKSA